MILRILYITAYLLSVAFADVAFTGPTAGESITGTSLTITWKDSGNSPKISDLATYQMFLCAGGNLDTNYIQLATLVQQGDFTQGSSVTVTLDTGLGSIDQDAYFIKVISAATGGSIINFSDRFSLPSMTGVFPAVVKTGLKTVTNTKGPATINQISSPQAGGAAGGASSAAGAAEYNTPYTLQTGQIRYAPMPPLAPTKISVKNKSRLWPTSAYTVYKTNAGTPNAITTNTEAQTFSVSSREATVVAASNPTDTAMARFLNRWKD